MALGGTREIGAVATKQITASYSSCEHDVNYSSLNGCSNQEEYWKCENASVSLPLPLFQVCRPRSEEPSPKPWPLPLKTS